MGMLDGLRQLMGAQVQTRSGDSIEDLIARMRPLRTSPWRSASNRDAMGVPAVFKAVSLISNTVGSLSMQAYRSGALLLPDDTPRIVIRPNPFTRPQVFWRDSAYYLARRGEAWWWTAKRDTDGSAMSLIPIDPLQITVNENPKNLLRPDIYWQNVKMPNDDMTQITYLPDPNNPLRGWGPLQACGAAVSVAVEAQEWAADFFAGNPTNTWIKSTVDIDEAEAEAIKTQWMTDTENLPKVTGPLIEDVKDVGIPPEQAQMTEARLFQNGEVALMFSMPPTLLNYSIAGSTITYQNVGQVADDLLRQCLLPHYLEPMEQAMTDLLTRQTTGEFNVDALLRADIKTRYDVYNVGIPLGVISVDEARQNEGLAPGNVEVRPVPFAAPQAIPASLPIQGRMASDVVHCPNCGKLVAEMATPPYRMRCRGCKAVVEAEVTETRSSPPAAPPVTVNLVNNVPEQAPIQFPRIPDTIVDLSPVAQALSPIAAALDRNTEATAQLAARPQLPVEFIEMAEAIRQANAIGRETNATLLRIADREPTVVVEQAPRTLRIVRTDDGATISESA